MIRKIGLHSYQLGTRGTEIQLYKYAQHLRDLKGYEPIIISTSSRPTPTLERFEKEFETFLYPDVWLEDGENVAVRKYLANLINKQQIDFLYAIKGGEDDGILRDLPCKTGAHCIFRMDEPHGDVYAGICEYISEKHGKIHPWVNHIFDSPAIDRTKNMREELNIPADALVGFRHGGLDTFSLPFVYSAIDAALSMREDIWFIFLNTRKTIDHPRVKYLDWTGDITKILTFVNTGDFFMHGRRDGEIAPCTVAEASMLNKAVVTWNPYQPIPGYDTGHLTVLGHRGLYYRNGNDLLGMLLTLKRDFILAQDWDVYKDTFSPEVVIEEFENIFLRGGASDK